MIGVPQHELSDYCTVIRLEALYTVECLAMNKKGLTEKLEAKERKILGPVKENGEYRRRHNHELYTHVEKITDTIRKRRITFYGHMTRMNSERLTNQMIAYFLSKKPEGPGSPRWKGIC